VKIVRDIVQCVCVARLLIRPAFARVSWRSALPIAVVRDHPWLRGETRLLNEINGRIPNGLCESKAIKEDNKEIACRISFEELIRDRSVWLGRENHGRHVESNKCLQQITKLSRTAAVTDGENPYGVNVTIKDALCWHVGYVGYGFEYPINEMFDLGNGPGSVLVHSNQSKSPTILLTVS
jgi:hypothetical protein